MSLADLPVWAAWSLLSGFILFGFWLLTWGEDKKIQTPTAEDFDGDDDLPDITLSIRKQREEWDR